MGNGLFKKNIFWLISLFLFILPFLNGGTSFLAQALILSAPLPLFLLRRAAGGNGTEVIQKKIIFLAIAFLFFVFISVVNSVSLAFSLPAFFQLLTISLFFYLFLVTASKENLKRGIAVILASSFLLCLLSFYYLLPIVKEKPEGMNLVYAIHGHSHLADYLILAIPLVLALFLRATKRKKKLFHGLLIFFLISLVLTFSRGAFLVLPLVVLIFIYLLKPKRIDEKIMSWSLVLIPVCFLVLILIFSLSPFGSKAKALFPDNWLTRQLVKPAFSARRLEYWQEALKGFLARPLFGFGWGNFKLVALRFQKLPASWSDYAHNFYLQVLAETGVFAFFSFLGFLYLSFYQIWQLVKKKKKDPILLGAFGAILASSLHSLLDYDWNFPAVFLAFLFLLANLLSLSSSRQSLKKDRRIIKLQVVPNWLVLIAVLCFIFGQMQIIGEHFYQKKEYKKAFFFSPWRKEFIIEEQEALLGKDFKTRKKNIDMAFFLYGDEPDILSFLLEKFYEREISEETAMLCYRTIAASPLENFALYPKLARLYDKLKMEKEKEELGIFFAQHLDKGREFYKNKPGYGKTFYLFGETYLGGQEEKAVLWWERAVEAGSQWSYFHIELASLYAKLGKFKEAEKVLTQCLNFYHPKEHCQMYLEKFKTQKKVEEPGHFRAEILEEIGD